MQFNTSNKKLIILINLPNSYKGGAQRRYFALFNHLQIQNRNEYYLLLNESLYIECIKDKILLPSKNIISVPVKFNRKRSSKRGHVFPESETIISLKKNSTTSLINVLGATSSFLKQLIGWGCFSLHLIRIIRQYKIRVIYGISTGGIWSWQVARLLGIKFIYSYMDASATMVDNSFIKVLNSEYFPLKYANRIDFLSEGIVNKLQDKGIFIKKERVLITPNSFIIPKNFYPIYPKRNRIVFSGRLTSLKNPHLLLDSILLLRKKKFSDFEMIFLGEGVLLNELIHNRNRLKLANVIFKGGVTDTAKYLRESKIFISIQNDNNYPSQSLMEAMACENAIIASNVGETNRLITKEEGILVSLDEESIAKAIRYLLNNPEICEQLGKNARKKVLKEQTIENYVKHFMNITQIE